VGGPCLSSPAALVLPSGQEEHLCAKWPPPTYVSGGQYASSSGMTDGSVILRGSSHLVRPFAGSSPAALYLFLGSDSAAKIQHAWHVRPRARNSSEHPPPPNPPPEVPPYTPARIPNKFVLRARCPGHNVPAADEVINAGLRTLRWRSGAGGVASGRVVTSGTEVTRRTRQALMGRHALVFPTQGSASRTSRVITAADVACIDDQTRIRDTVTSRTSGVITAADIACIDNQTRIRDTVTSRTGLLSAHDTTDVG
jgi:hypothetical protein